MTQEANEGSRIVDAAVWQLDPGAAEQVADEVASLGWTYVSRLSGERKPNEILDRLALLSESDAALIRRLRFVTSKEAEELVFGVGPRILRRLPQTTRRVRELVREVRGRVDWASTFRDRLAHGGDPTLLAVSRGTLDADVAENRVLAFLLDRLSEMSRAVSVRPDGQPIVGRSRAAELGLAADRLRAASMLASIPMRSRVSGSERQALRTSRLPEYRNEVAALLDLHEGLFEGNDLGSLRRLLGERIWLPPEPERLFELWILFMAAKGLEEAGWAATAISLIGGSHGTSSAFRFTRANAEVNLSYQTLPRALLDASRYTPLIQRYGIGGSARRPDFVVTARVASTNARMLWEAKLTNNRQYIADSIYKTLGYVGDFGDALGDVPPTRAVLLVWSGIKPALPSPIDEIVILDAASVRAGGLVSLVDDLAEKAREDADKSASI